YRASQGGPQSRWSLRRPAVAVALGRRHRSDGLGKPGGGHPRRRNWHDHAGTGGTGQMTGSPERFYAAACQLDMPNPRGRDEIARSVDRMLQMIDGAVEGYEP